MGCHFYIAPFDDSPISPTDDDTFTMIPIISCEEHFLFVSLLKQIESGINLFGCILARQIFIPYCPYSPPAERSIINLGAVSLVKLKLFIISFMEGKGKARQIHPLPHFSRSCKDKRKGNLFAWN